MELTKSKSLSYSYNDQRPALLGMIGCMDHMCSIRGILLSQTQLICQQNQLLGCICENGQQTNALLAGNNPLTVFAEYPEEVNDPVLGDIVLYKTDKVIFTNMLNDKLIVSFRGIIPVNKPVYFEDGSGFKHVISLSVGGIPVDSSFLVNKEFYQALFSGNFIVIS